MKLKLPSSIHSVQDVTALIMEVKTYNHWFSHAAIKKRIGVKSIAAEPILSAAASEIIRSWEAKKPLSPQTLDELTVLLEEYVHKSPTLTITLAAPAANDLKNQLVGWCRDHIAPDMLVTFRFNATILGGMVIHYGSRVFDWSFRRQILANREHFPEVLRHV